MDSTTPFIAIEGIDGAGTTTLMHNLRELLEERGHSVHTTSEPSRGEIGLFIRKLLSPDYPLEPDSTTLALLFAADRRLHLLTEIRPALAKGSVVLSDRYILSSLAYQSIGEDPLWVKTLNQRVSLPHLLIYVDIEPDVAMARITARGKALERLETLEFQKMVRQNYVNMLASWEGPSVALSGEDPPDVLAQKALSHCLDLLP
ncbi:dTMP kinase [Myxococcota bacterium]|nr:dTMP kinase [Myxococcota bacterium]MBU1534238.1 dTMP kinase [Myxococcota bacterium]